MAMVKNTPIRLVAIDEEPPHDEPTQTQELLSDEDTGPTPVEKAGPVEDAAPVRSLPEHEAITRRMPATATQAAAQAPEWPKPTPSWRRFIPLAIAIVPVIALSTAWLLGRSPQTPAKETAAPAAVQASPPSPSLPAPTPGSPTVPTTVPAMKAPEVIRLQITAEPAQAELGLDGNVLAGNQLNLEVPKDRSIHVVSATAPGYFPFNQQVSFSNDVVLRISLRRAHGPVARPVARPRASTAPVVSKPIPSAPQIEQPKPQSTGKRSTSSRLEPGMDLDVAAPRHGAKSIDERNPYRP